MSQNYIEGRKGVGQKGGTWGCPYSMFCSCCVYLVQLFSNPPRDQRDLLAPRGLLVSQETKGMLEHQDKLGPRDPLDLL